MPPVHLAWYGTYVYEFVSIAQAFSIHHALAMQSTMMGVVQKPTRSHAHSLE